MLGLLGDPLVQPLLPRQNPSREYAHAVGEIRAQAPAVQSFLKALFYETMGNIMIGSGPAGR